MLSAPYLSPEFQRLFTVLDATASSVVNEGLIMSQILLPSDTGEGRDVPMPYKVCPRCYRHNPDPCVNQMVRWDEMSLTDSHELPAPQALHTRATKLPSSHRPGLGGSVTVHPCARRVTEKCNCERERDTEPQRCLLHTKTFVNPLTQIFHQHTATSQFGVQGVTGPAPGRTFC